jgi:hypothetical protein
MSYWFATVYIPLRCGEEVFMTLLQVLLKDLTPADWFGSVVVRVRDRKAWVRPMAGGFEVRLSSVLLMTTEIRVASTASVTAAVENLIEAELVEMTRLAEIELERIRANCVLQQ